MELKSLRLFVTAAKSGSFNAAADQHHTVQSNVTAHIKKLESELDTRLFERKGGISLTSAGHVLMEYAQRILDTHDHTLAVFRQQQNDPGQLRIGAMETTTAVRLPPILTAFNKAFPNVQLSIETNPSAMLVERLLAGEFDAIFVAGKAEHPNLDAQAIFQEKLVLVGQGEDFELPEKDVLLQAPFLAFRQGCSYRQRIELLLSNLGIHAKRITEFGSIDGILGCVAAGMGYTLMPLSTIEDHQHRFDISYCEIPEHIAMMDTYFVTSKADGWSPALKDFASLLTTKEQPA